MLGNPVIISWLDERAAAPNYQPAAVSGSSFGVMAGGLSSEDRDFRVPLTLQRLPRAESARLSVDNSEFFP